MTEASPSPADAAPESALERVVAPIARAAGALAAAIVLVALGVTAYGVLMRYVVGTPVTWVDELSGYLVIGIVMLGAAHSLLQGDHIRVDLLTSRFAGQRARVLEIWAMFAVLLVAAALVYSGVLMLRYSIGFGLYSEGYLETPMWIPQAVLFGGAILLGVAAIARIAGLVRPREG